MRQTQLSDFTINFSLSWIGEGNGNPLWCSCLENPRDGGAWWAAVYGVSQSRTRLKWLSSSSRLWCWEGLGAGGEGDDRGWDGWMVSPTQWTWVRWTLGVGDGQGGLACCNSWGRKEWDMTEWLNWTELKTCWENNWYNCQKLVISYPQNRSWWFLLKYKA